MAAASAIYESEIDRILGPVVQPRTYRTLLYLALSFPFGLVYFITMIVGIALGTGLAIIVVGFGILALTLLLARTFVRLERWLTESLLYASLEPRPPYATGFRAMLFDRRNWTGVLYLLLRLPLGVAGLISSVLALVAVLAMAAPVLYPLIPYSIDGERITQSEPALLISVFGCVLFIGVVHAINGLGAISRKLAEALL
jgi:Putative sensor